jgi:hypothetical protein
MPGAQQYAMTQPQGMGVRPMQAPYTNPYAVQGQMQGMQPGQFQPPPQIQYQQPPMQQWTQQQMAQMAGQDMNPPAVHSTAVQTPYSPQPSQGSPGVGQPGQVAAAGVPGAGAGQLPPPPNLTQPPGGQQAQGAQPAGRPDGRDRCYGRHDPASNLCLTCPGDLKPGCMSVSAAATGGAAQQGLTIEQLQAKLQGRG